MGTRRPVEDPDAQLHPVADDTILYHDPRSALLEARHTVFI